MAGKAPHKSFGSRRWARAALQTAIVFCFAAGAASSRHSWRQSGAQQDNGLPKPPVEVAKLGAFVGRWKIEGSTVDSPFGKAAKSSTIATCNWSRNGYFVICDEAIQSPAGPQDTLFIFGYNTEQKGYMCYGIDSPGGEPYSVRLIIDGNTWTYPAEFKRQDKTIKFRTINMFKSPDLVLYKTEYSDDGGASWHTSGEGTETRIK